MDKTGAQQYSRWISTSLSSSSDQGFPWVRSKGMITHLPLPFSLIRSFSKEMEAFIFMPQGQPTMAEKD